MKINKLIITKNTKLVDSNNLFTYKFQWYNDTDLVLSEIRKVESDEMMTPKETYDVEELKEHKISSGFEIDSLEVETVTI
jgi:hypothetical protein